MKFKIYKAFSIALSLALFCSLNGFSQSPKIQSTLKKATEDYNNLRYIAAINGLSQVLRADTGNVKAQEMIAYSYRMIKNYTEAMYWYEKLTRQQNIKPEWSLYYAEALANNQQYERSEGWYRKYLTLAPADKRAAAFSASNLNLFSKNIGHWKVSFTNLNSQGSDYAPAYYKDGLMFTSNRQTQKLVKRIFEWDKTPFSNIYVVPSLKNIRPIAPDSLKSIGAAREDSRYRFNDDDTPPTSNDTQVVGQANPTLSRDTIAILLEKELNLSLLKGLSTKFHEGTSAAFPDGSIIFTRNNFNNGRSQSSKDGVNKLKMYVAAGSDLSRITEFPYNDNEYSTGHPTLNADGTILIFASDRPGGYGGSDLYYCVRSGSGQWTRPINLGKQINTEGNELFPFLDKQGYLIFASTGHAGLGGLDLFEVALKEMKPTSAPRNLGAPINSSTDDFSLIRAQDGKSGYFSSNRRGNDDIYEFKRATQLIVFEGRVIDARTRLPLAGSRLLMKHLDGIDTIRTNARGEFRRELPPETDYEITTQKIGYVNQIGFVSSLGITRDSTIKMDIPLSKTENAQQYVLNNCDSLKRVFAVQNIYYDLDQYSVRPDARPALDELAALMKKYPEISVITSSHCDSRASEVYNRNLSIRRGEAAKAYLVARGISAYRITVEYYGKTRLLNRCYEGVPCSEHDQQLNRRTEFDVILNGVNLTRQNCADR